MKHLLLFLIIFPLLTACPPAPDRRENSIKNLIKNDYNLKPLKKASYREITFEIPETFKQDYSNNHVYRSSAYALTDYALGINFTVERLIESDIYSELMVDQVIKTDLLNGFHDAYVQRRVNSLDKGISTYKKKIYNPSKFDGIIQTVSYEPEDQYEEVLYYATATLKVEKEYYVFQFIAEKSMMAYLYDDFERIISSVRKIK